MNPCEQASKDWLAHRGFGGLDWASQSHAIIIVDAHGRVVEDFQIEHSALGWKKFRERLQPYGSIPFAIETSQGAAVEQLLEAGMIVYPLNPKSAQAYRERKAPSGTKDDRLDAWSFADACRVDKSKRPTRAETSGFRNLGMDRPKKQLGAEALIDLHRRLSAFPTRSHERRLIMRETASLYGVSEQTLYRALAQRAQPRALRRSDRGTPRVLPPDKMEYYCELIAALKVRTSNKKGRHLSTGEAIRLLERFGVETPDGLMKAQASMFKTTTVNRYLRQWGYDHETLRRQRSVFKPNTATTAGNSI